VTSDNGIIAEMRIVCDVSITRCTLYSLCAYIGRKTHNNAFQLRENVNRKIPGKGGGDMTGVALQRYPTLHLYIHPGAADYNILLCAYI